MWFYGVPPDSTLAAVGAVDPVGGHARLRSAKKALYSNVQEEIYDWTMGGTAGVDAILVQ